MKPKVILVMDKPKTIRKADLSRNDLEGYNDLASKLTKEAFETFSSVILYTDLKKFARRLLFHKDAVVFPMRWGKTSKTGKGLVPSVCETHGIPYVGADAYTQLLCNDKYLAKLYTHEFGLQVPEGIPLYKEQSEHEILDNLHQLTYPIVIKPNFGGGSSGISANSIADGAQDALKLVKELFRYGFSPVLAEEYVEGREVSLLLAGTSKEVSFCDEVQLEVNGESYFKHSLWGFETKKVDLASSHYQISSLVSEKECENARRLFLSFDKANYLRIDGRVNEKGFFVIELSPDCYIGPESDFSVAFASQGKSLEEFYQFLFTLARE